MDTPCILRQVHREVLQLVSLGHFSLISTARERNSAREIVPPAAHLEESLMHPPAIANRLLMGLPRTRIRLPELQRLNGIARVAQVHRVSSDIADLQHPLPAEGPLNREIPLLSVRHLEVARNFQDEDGCCAYTIAARLVSVNGSLRRVHCRSGGTVGMNDDEPL